MSEPPYVAVVGPGEATAAELDGAEEIGRRVGQAGGYLVCGGLGGVMEAACRGASEAGGLTIGILPGSSRAAANRWVTVSVPTGLGELRNGLIVRASDAVVAVGGAYGTLSEIALALNTGVPVVGIASWPIDGIERAGSPREAAERAIELARRVSTGRSRAGA